MNPWKNFAVAYISIISFTFVFQSLPPILRPLSADLGLNHAQAGLLMGLFALPGILLTIPGGLLTDRFGVKKVAAASLLIMITGALASAFAPDFVTLGVARIIAGTGGLVLIVAAASLVSNSFSGRDLGRAMGLYGTGLPLGTIIGFALFGYIGTEFGWRPALIVSGLAGLVPLALLYLMLEDDKSTAGPALHDSIVDTFRRTWPLGLVWLWFNAGLIAFLTFAPEFLTQAGFAPEAANFIAALVMWGALIVSPLVGLFMTNRRRKVWLIMSGSVLSAATLAIMPSAMPYIVPLIILLGLAAALAPAPLFALPAELVGPERQGITFGLISTSLNVGILIGPFLVGLARDRTGSHTAGFYLMAVFLILAAVSALPVLRKPA